MFGSTQSSPQSAQRCWRNLRIWFKSLYSLMAELFNWSISPLAAAAYVWLSSPKSWLCFDFLCRPFHDPPKNEWENLLHRFLRHHYMCLKCHGKGCLTVNHKTAQSDHLARKSKEGDYFLHLPSVFHLSLGCHLGQLNWQALKVGKELQLSWEKCNEEARIIRLLSCLH